MFNSKRGWVMALAESAKHIVKLLNADLPRWKFQEAWIMDPRHNFTMVLVTRNISLISKDELVEMVEGALGETVIGRWF